MNNTSMDQGAVLRWICSLIWVMAKRATDTWQGMSCEGWVCQGLDMFGTCVCLVFFRRDCRSSRFHLGLFLPVTVLGDFVVSIWPRILLGDVFFSLRGVDWAVSCEKPDMALLLLEIADERNVGEDLAKQSVPALYWSVLRGYMDVLEGRAKFFMVNVKSFLK